MTILKARFVNDLAYNDVEALHSILNAQEKCALEFHLWKKQNKNKPEVSFSIAHNNHAVLLKFFVEEKAIRAKVTNINGPVWEDSCVEFFVSFDESGYYNFEFNCIGTLLSAFGKNRNERKFLPEEILKKVKTHTKLMKREDGFYWEMLIVIPIETFVHHSLQSLSGKICKANFYKCGDGLLHPHYLAWSNIHSDIPDFHLPDFFGEVRFE